MAAGVTSRPRFEITASDCARAGVRNVPIRVRYFPGDLAVERFLLELGKYRRESMGGNSLLAFRDDFRQIIAYRPCAGLREFLGVCSPEHPAFLIGVWLLGRCATPQATYILERLPADRSPQARRHFARALRRIECWPRLRRLAADYPGDTDLAALISDGPGATFHNRLERFATHVDKSHAAEADLASRMPLWFRDHDWHRTEPKRPSFIRLMLERIKQWVRGE
jgi:hypothetical protein